MRTIYPVIYSKYLFIYFSEPHWWRKIVSVLSSSAVDRGFEPRSDQTEDYEIGIFSLRSLRTQNSGERVKSGCLGIRIMCQSGATCLSADCCFVWASTIFQDFQEFKILLVHSDT